MMPRPDRILLIRSGRHLQVALDVLRQRYPDSHISVVATPGTDSARLQAHIDPADWIVYGAQPQFDAWPMLRSGLAARLWTRGFDRVAVLWQDPEGSDRANVDRAAALLAPRGFDAITPDGTLLRRRPAAFILRQGRTALCSAVMRALIALALYAPASVAASLRRPNTPEAR